MLKNGFVNEFVTKLDGDFTEEELKKIMIQLQMFINDYNIDKKSTELIVYDGIPKAYQVFMVTKKIEGRSDKTLEQYRICLEDMFERLKKEITLITTDDIRVYLYSIQKERKISDRTLDNKRLIINGFFSWCVQEGYLDRNPCASISPIKYEEKPRVPFTDIEMERMRSACETPKERAILETLYATGCRCSELTRLQLTDIDFKKREVELFGKGKKHRVSYINARAEVAIEKYLETRTDNKPYLFVSDRKPYKKMTNSGIEKILHNIGKKSGVHNVIPHRVRHTFATDALNRGMPVTVLQSLMGHEKLDTTTIYAKISKVSVSVNHQKYVI